jgi:hypothetical protein
VVHPINQYQGHGYTELTKDVIDGSMVDTIDNLSEGMRGEYVNPTTDGAISWCNICSFYIDPNDAL